MRIIAGLHKGRRLKPIKGNKIRPTTDRVREAIFSVLAERLAEASVLDLFCGSGALGIEALSRGASHATFVDKDFDAVKLVKSNLELVDEFSRSTILKGDVFRICERLGREAVSFDVIFADPPYKTEFHDALVELVAANKLLAPGGVFVYETRPQFELTAPQGNFRETKIKNYGDTKVWFLFD